MSWMGLPLAAGIMPPVIIVKAAMLAGRPEVSSSFMVFLLALIEARDVPDLFRCFFNHVA
jgi:hypothetical protein